MADAEKQSSFEAVMREEPKRQQHSADRLDDQTVQKDPALNPHDTSNFDAEPLCHSHTLFHADAPVCQQNEKDHG